MLVMAGCWWVLLLLLLLRQQRTWWCTTAAFRSSSTFASSPRRQQVLVAGIILESESSNADFTVRTSKTDTTTTTTTTTTTRMANSTTTSPSSTVSEGSLIDMTVASTLAQQPGSTPAFYNPMRRVGRDCSVLSVAQWLLQRQSKKQPQLRPNEQVVNVLDAHAASGIAGLRVAMESPILAESFLLRLEQKNQEKNSSSNPTTSNNNNNNSMWNNLDDNTTRVPPPLHVVLNDVDPAAVQVAVHNTQQVVIANKTKTALLPSITTTTTSTVSVSNKNSQSLWHETSFDISLVDPFGCTTAYLDAALAQAPQGGLIDICATDVTALYGGRPAMVSRHYNGAHFSSSGGGISNNNTTTTTTHHARPPCFKERGVRLLLAAVAQAAGRHDRGIKPLYSLSTAHYVVVAIQVVRRGKEAKTFGPDATMRHVQCISICPSCGAAVGGTRRRRRSNDNDNDDITILSLAPSPRTTPPDCSCDYELNRHRSEGPLWLGPLHDPTHLQGMIRLVGLPQAQEWITPETKRVLQTMYEESMVESSSSNDDSSSLLLSRNKYSLFHRRPSLAAPGQMPRLDHLIYELQNRGYKACRTQFDSHALKSNASPTAFDDAVRALL